MLLTARNFDASGQIVGFGFHDSMIIGLAYEDESKLTFRLRRGNRTVVRLECTGVGAFGAIGHRLPATVSEVFAWHPDKTPDDAATLPDGAWTALYGNDISPQSLPDAIRCERAEGKYRYLMSIICSFGGTMAALCGGIAVVDENGGRRS